MSEILNEINQLKNLGGKICLKNGQISTFEKSLHLNLFADFIPDDRTVEDIESFILSKLPKSFKSVKCSVKKIVSEKRFVLDAVKEYLLVSHKAIASLIDGTRSVFSKDGYNASVKLYVETSAYEYMVKKSIGAELTEYLNDSFVEDFTVSIEDVGADSLAIDNSTESKIENPVYRRERRFFKVDEVQKLFDDDTTDKCVYIADTKDFLGEIYVGGVINKIEERETKTGKPFFLIEITDRTGVLTGTLFPTKAQLPKVKKLAPGSEIIARGEFAIRGEFRNFTYRSVNLCVFPQNFVPKERAHRPCPADYTVVFPQKLVIETQDNFLENKTIPSCFIDRTFVVFDLETTGVDPDDKITEIGAVKMVDGVAVEYFSTLVNPERPIPAEVVGITGIDDEMVKDAPVFEDVCGDFYKFCYGATLVAHNIDFDSRFIKKQGQAIDYYFDNPLMDTLALARETLHGMKNYKLNTLCDKFGIKFRHHRAYSDALATSELFVEIIRQRGSLPF